jgi:TetR/AcrR family transcriptional repressor of nem operon
MTKGAATRQRIIAKAAPLFNQKGYEGCSMQDIVAATELEKASIYRYFSSKEELATEAFDYAWKDASAKRLSNLSKVENSVDKLKLHIENLVSIPAFPGGCPLLNTAIDADNGNRALRAKARQALRGWQSVLCSIVTEGKEKQEIREEVDPAALASLMIALIEGASAIGRLERSSCALGVAQEHLHAYLENNVRKLQKTGSPH